MLPPSIDVLRTLQVEELDALVRIRGGGKNDMANDTTLGSSHQSGWRESHHNVLLPDV